MRCDGCRHWDRDYGYGHVKGGPIRVCVKTVMFWEATEWDADSDRVLKPEYADQKSFVQDGSDYNAILLTKADFFCAHFEEE